MNPSFTAILDLTDRVQEAIDGGDWPRAQELEAERRAAIERLVTEQAVSAELQAALGDLYARNQRMIGEVHHHRRRLEREALTVRTGRAAIAAYGEASGSGSGG
jgi:hypothetical protein